MKMKTVEQWIMLEQSGELSPKQERKLAAVLDSSEEARRLREDLALLSRSVPKSNADPDPWAVTKINARLQDAPRRTITLPYAWTSALAAAACLVVAFNLVDLKPSRISSASEIPARAAVLEEGVWNDPLGEDLAELENLILAISGDPLDITTMQ